MAQARSRMAKNGTSLPDSNAQHSTSAWRQSGLAAVEIEHQCLRQQRLYLRHEGQMGRVVEIAAQRGGIVKARAPRRWQRAAPQKPPARRRCRRGWRARQNGTTRYAQSRLATCSGLKITLNTLPLSGSLWMSSLAWWRASTCLTMARPRPVPPLPRERPRSTR